MLGARETPRQAQDVPEAACRSAAFGSIRPVPAIAIGDAGVTRYDFAHQHRQGTVGDQPSRRSDDPVAREGHRRGSFDPREAPTGRAT